MRKEAVVAYFKVLFQYLLGKTDEGYLKSSIEITGLW
jgi:hypothetical protein